jgi:hypothetical protein
MLGYGKGEEPEREIELVKYSDTCARPDFPPPFTVTGGNSSRYFHAKQFSPMRRALMALLPGEMLARRRQGMNVSAYKLRNISNVHGKTNGVRPEMERQTRKMCSLLSNRPIPQNIVAKEHGKGEGGFDGRNGKSPPRKRCLGVVKEDSNP